MTAPAVSGDVVVNYRAKGVEQVQASFRRVAGEGAASLEKTGRATQRISMGLLEVARSGEIANRGFTEILRSVSEIALGFGPEGLFIGALATAGLAVYENLVKPFKEARDEADKFQKQIGDLANTGNTSELQKQLRDVSFGQPFDKNGKLVANSKFVSGAFEGSLADLEAHYAALQKQIPAGATMVRGPLATEINEVVEKLDEARTKFKQLKDAMLNVANQPAMTQAGTLLGMTTTATGAITPELRRQLEAMNAETASTLAAAEAQRQGQSLALFNNPHIRTPGALPGINTIGPQNAALSAPVAASVTTGLGTAKKVFLSEIDGIAQTLQQGISTTIGDAISAGFDAAFSGQGIGGAMKALSGTALKGLGAMFKEIGEKALIGMHFLQGIITAIDKWNPALGIAASIGLIALGSALQAGGNAIGGGGSRGANYGYSSAGYSAAPAPIVVGPGAMPSLAGVSPKAPVTVNATIIGPNDPQAGRQLLDLISTAQRRVS